MFKNIGATKIIQNFNKEHPHILDKAFDMFASHEYEFFSIQEANFCACGRLDGYSAESIYLAEIIRIYTLWQKDRVEYKFENEYLDNNLSYISEVKKRLFIRQPFKCYYVQLDGLPIDGFFIATKYHFDIDKDFRMGEEHILYDNNEVFLSLILNNSETQTLNVNFNINLNDSENLEQVVRMGLNRLTHSTPFINPKQKQTVDMVVDLAILAINIAYHISELNSNRPNTFKSDEKHYRPTSPSERYSDEYCRRFFIRQPNGSSSGLNSNNDITYSKKHPHVRSGHWHHYWIGARNSENRKLIVKWIESTTVNCNNRKDLPTVTIQR